MRININHMKLEMLRAGSKSLFVKYHKSYFRQINDHGLTLCATEITKDLSLQKSDLMWKGRICRLTHGKKCRQHREYWFMPVPCRIVQISYFLLWSAFPSYCRIVFDYFCLTRQFRQHYLTIELSIECRPNWYRIGA